jgi:type II restriction enzyme
MNLLIEVALLIKKYQNTISVTDKKEMLEDLERVGLYNPRFSGAKQSTLDSKINQLAFYMFGYKTKINGKNKFLFSPLGNLLLKHKNDEIKRDKIFLTMLWGLQYNHPHSKTDEEYQLYPFRLLFKLMNEKRLNKRLFISEISYFVMMKKDINLASYEQLVTKILNFRTKTTTEISEIFLKDRNNILVNAVYECDYYLKIIMEYFNLIKSFDGALIVKLSQGKSTTRRLNNSYCTINKDILDYMEELENNYSFINEPLKFTGNQHRLDVIKEIYNFYPQILLKEIDENINYNVLQLPKLIDEFSKNKDNSHAYKFEDILVKGFNIFIDVDAQKIAGAGNTDIECLYLIKNKKFAVEAKSTKNKLSLVNNGRLKFHREKIGAEYTIVITPRYVPAVLRDIKDTNIVIITASTFSEFLYNSILENERNISYKEIDNLIINNLGSDISDRISNITINKFATPEDNLKIN